MSRGPGRVERTIEAAFTGAPDQTFSTTDLGPIVYPGIDQPERRHRVSINRAAHQVGLRIHWRGRWRGGPGGEKIWYNLMNARSYRLSMLRLDEKRYHGALDDLEARLDSPNHRQSEWHKLQPGGVWAVHVEIHRADMSGDIAEAERLRAELGRLWVDGVRRKAVLSSGICASR